MLKNYKINTKGLCFYYSSFLCILLIFIEKIIKKGYNYLTCKERRFNFKKSIIFITILLILFIIGCDTNNSHYKSQYKAVGLLRESTSNNYSISFKKTRTNNGA